MVESHKLNITQIKTICQETVRNSQKEKKWCPLPEEKIIITFAMNLFIKVMTDVPCGTKSLSDFFFIQQTHIKQVELIAAMRSVLKRNIQTLHLSSAILSQWYKHYGSHEE
jgi:hypothetical protein